MRFYNLLFVGLFQLADKTEYKGISEYVASFGVAFIIELNLIGIIGLTTLRQDLLKPYILVSFFVLMIILNVTYYRHNKLTFDKLSADLKDRHRPNMTTAELIGILMIIEAALAPVVFRLIKQ